jgi:pimeloyl-ACP methyl ester carboxylesterase
MTEEIFIYHSTDDTTVPYSHSEKIKSYLPKAKLITFTNRGHIRQQEFPELLENILHG